MGKLPPEADALVRRVAKERGCKLYSLVDRFSDEADLPRTNLAGGFQRWNAGLATYAIEILSKRFPFDLRPHSNKSNGQAAGKRLSLTGVSSF